uniref:J domain-containing protein n=1 Tax=Odontella aurita TaxID=265563 RepID=A0A7S4HMB3_9STRA
MSEEEQKALIDGKAPSASALHPEKEKPKGAVAAGGTSPKATPSASASRPAKEKPKGPIITGGPSPKMTPPASRLTKEKPKGPIIIGGPQSSKATRKATPTASRPEKEKPKGPMIIGGPSSKPKPKTTPSSASRQGAKGGTSQPAKKSAGSSLQRHLRKIESDRLAPSGTKKEANKTKQNEKRRQQQQRSKSARQLGGAKGAASAAAKSKKGGGSDQAKAKAKALDAPSASAEKKKAEEGMKLDTAVAAAAAASTVGIPVEKAKIEEAESQVTEEEVAPASPSGAPGASVGSDAAAATAAAAELAVVTPEALAVKAGINEAEPPTTEEVAAAIPSAPAEKQTEGISSEQSKKIEDEEGASRVEEEADTAQQNKAMPQAGAERDELTEDTKTLAVDTESQSEKREADAHVDRLAEEIEVLKANAEAASRKREEDAAEAECALQSATEERDKTRENASKIKAERDGLAEEIETLKVDVAESGCALETAREERDDARRRASSLEAENEELELRVADASNELDRARDQIRTFEEGAAEHADMIEELTKNVRDSFEEAVTLRAQIEDVRMDLFNAEEEQDALQSQYVGAQAEIEELTSALRAAEELSEETKAELDGAQEERSALEAELQDQKQAQEKATCEKGRLAGELEATSKEWDSSRAEVSTLEEMVAKLKQNNNNADSRSGSFDAAERDELQALCRDSQEMIMELTSSLRVAEEKSEKASAELNTLRKGQSTLEVRRATLEAQLEAATREKDRLVEELRSVPPRRNSPHAQDKISEKYEKASAELEDAREEHSSLQAKSSTLETKLEAAIRERDRMADELRAVSAERNSSRAEITRLRMAVAGTEKSREDEQNAKADVLEEKLRNAKERISSLADETAEMKLDLEWSQIEREEALEAERSRSSNEISDLTSALRAAEERCESVNSPIPDDSASREEDEQERSSSSSLLEAKLEATARERDRLAEELRAASAERNTAQAEVARLHRERGGGWINVNSDVAVVGELKVERERASVLATEKAALEMNLEQNRVEREDVLEEERTRSDAEASQLRDRISDLEAKMDALNSAHEKEKRDMRTNLLQMLRTQEEEARTARGRRTSPAPRPDTREGSSRKEAQRQRNWWQGGLFGANGSAPTTRGSSPAPDESDYGPRRSRSIEGSDYGPSRGSRRSSSMSRSERQNSHYDILNVGSNVEVSEIKKAYKKMALQYHPDKTKDPQDTEKFHRINTAYEVLSDDERRKQYDRELSFTS